MTPGNPGSLFWAPADIDPDQQGPCVVAAINKFIRTTEILWRKRDDTVVLSVKDRAGPVPCLDRLLLLFFLGTLH